MLHMLNQFVSPIFLPTEPTPLQGLKKAAKGLKKAAERQLVRLQDQPFKVARRDQLFDVEKQIGHGSFGKVFLARDKHTGRRVALKQVRLEGQTVSTIFREVDFLSKMRNDYIVQMYDNFRTSLDSIYIVLELCTGGELFDTVSTKFLPEHIIKQVTFEILSGIQYAHSKQIAHLDLKLENVVLSRPWNGHVEYFPTVKIIDWGLGKHFSEFETCPCGIVGTPTYVAPEVLLRHYNHKADLWSLGVIIYAMVSGTFPFDGETRVVLYKNIMEANPSYEEDGWLKASTNNVAFVLSLLTRDVHSRPEAEDALQHAWFSSGTQSVRNEFVVSRLHKYLDVNVLKRRLLGHLVTQNLAKTNSEAVKQLCVYFKGVAGEKETIPARVVKEALLAWATQTNAEYLVAEASMYDIREDDVIDVDEFIVAMLSPFYNTRKRLMHFFNASNMRYELTKAALCKFFNGDEEKAERLFREVDQNKDGNVDVDEFIQWMLHDI